MSDRELIELAAKAATYEYECTSHTGYPKDDQHQIRAESGSLMEWNPLNSDGDALRLAVKLNMTVNMAGICHWGAVTDVTTPWHAKQKLTGIHPETHGNDPYAATRRAIVRAAAEIGKAKGE